MYKSQKQFCGENRKLFNNNNKNIHINKKKFFKCRMRKKKKILSTKLNWVQSILFSLDWKGVQIIWHWMNISPKNNQFLPITMLLLRHFYFFFFKYFIWLIRFKNVMECILFKKKITHCTIPNDFTTFSLYKYKKQCFWTLNLSRFVCKKKQASKKKPLVVTDCNKLKHSRLNNVITNLLFVVVQGSGSRHKCKENVANVSIFFFVKHQKTVRLYNVVLLKYIIPVSWCTQKKNK